MTEARALDGGCTHDLDAANRKVAGASGEKLEVFCARHGFSAGTLKWWDLEARA